MVFFGFWIFLVFVMVFFTKKVFCIRMRFFEYVCTLLSEFRRKAYYPRRGQSQSVLRAASFVKAKFVRKNNRAISCGDSQT